MKFKNFFMIKFQKDNLFMVYIELDRKKSIKMSITINSKTH